MSGLRWVALAAAAALGGCVTDPTSMDFTGGSATLEFTKGYDQGVGLGTSTVQYFIMSDKPDCPKDKGNTLHWLSKSALQFQVAADRRLVLDTTTRFFSSSGGYNSIIIINRPCEDIAAFVPQQGHTYAVRHVASLSGCHLSVVDKATGNPPPDLRMLPDGDVACRAYLSGQDQ